MSLEWFDRVCAELQDNMESICEEYDEIGHINIDRAAKHPRIDCFVEDEDNIREYFCTLYFDPHNEEFYVEEFDLETELTSRVLLDDIDEIIDVVHESFHDFIDSFDMDDDEYEEEYLMEDDTIEYDEDEEDDDEVEMQVVVDVDWTTPEVLAYTYLDEVEVAYRFGVVPDTGDGVLRRVNRIVTEENTVIEDESDFIFSKEEAGTIIELIENNMDMMEGFDVDH
ncbi:hypothetical protein [Bacillus alkalicellulosilyticus]|uniref:hypothetical protein n=1 Tax=Alkalihalobacterium alkalicellulosilyticum TaxID=1912214 RepID=UPI0009975D1B|nr:hypothetical protein [Bacillus alkalicellulosilyticus]